MVVQLNLNSFYIKHNWSFSMAISEEMKYQLQIIVDAGEIVKALIEEGHEDIAIFDEPLTDILGATNEVLQEIDGGWS